MKIHISVDDFLHVLQELADRKAVSLFDHPVMGFIRRMHEEYDMHISCYCFLKDEAAGADLRNVPDTWRMEWQENRAWLKLGFHGLCNEANYGSRKFQTGDMRTTAQEAGEDYRAVVTELVRITGGGECIDRMPRIHYYAGTKEACLAWRDCEYGITGLLSAEDDRCCYYHDLTRYETLIRQGVMEDQETGLCFRRTDIRLENTEDVISAMQRVREQYPEKLLTVFTHEKYLYQEKIRERLEACMRYAVQQSL